jgi:hypothetical protein
MGAEGKIKLLTRPLKTPFLVQKRGFYFSREQFRRLIKRQCLHSGAGSCGKYRVSGPMRAATRVVAEQIQLLTNLADAPGQKEAYPKLHCRRIARR